MGIWLIFELWMKKKMILEVSVWHVQDIGEYDDEEWKAEDGEEEFWSILRGGGEN